MQIKSDWSVSRLINTNINTNTNSDTYENKIIVSAIGRRT